MSPLTALQRGIHARLIAALPGVPVYDDVPQDAAFPYVVIGRMTSEDDDLLVEQYRRVTVPITLHARETGLSPIHDRAEIIRVAFHDVLFELEDAAAVIECRVRRQVIDDGQDAKTYHASSILSVLLEL